MSVTGSEDYKILLGFILIIEANFTLNFKNLGYSSLVWIGLDWIGLDWIGLDWIGLEQARENRIE